MIDCEICRKRLLRITIRYDCFKAIRNKCLLAIMTRTSGVLIKYNFGLTTKTRKSENYGRIYILSQNSVSELQIKKLEKLKHRHRLHCRYF